MLATGVAVGFVNGFVFVKGRLPHPFIITLATLSIARGLALWLSDGSPIQGMPEPIQALGGMTLFGWLPPSAFVVAGVAIAVAVLTTRMVWGRWIYAVGRQPGRRATDGHPGQRRAHLRLRPEWPDGRHRRGAHRGSDQRRGARPSGRSPSSTRSPP